MTEGLAVNKRLQSRLLLGLLIVGILTLSFIVTQRLHHKETSAAGAVKEAPSLPPDVDGVMTSFSFSESTGDVTTKISGKSVVRRGRRLLGMRSNLAKTNFIENLTGSLRTRKGVTTFSAAEAEWEGASARPLHLKKKVSISIDGRPLPQAKQATVHLDQGTLEVDNGKRYFIK